MRKSIILFCPAFLLLCFGSVVVEERNTALTVEDIIGRNIEATGGKARIEAVKNISFDVPSTRLRESCTSYIASAGGELKIVGKVRNLTARVAVVKNGKMKVADFSPSGELTSLEKAKMQCLAKLFAGAFTLMKFEKGFTNSGMKKFGPEQFYILKTTSEGHEVSFYLGVENFLVKRVIFEGFDDKQGNYKTIIAFTNPQNIDGLNIPSTWFESYLRAGYSNDNAFQSITNVKIGQELEEQFFENLDIDFGNPIAAEGSLKGNMVDSVYVPSTKNVILEVNWTENHIKKTGFKSRDDLILKIGKQEFPAVYVPDFYDFTDEDRSTMDIIFLVQAPGYPLVWLVFQGEKYKPVHDEFELLCPVSIYKTNKCEGE